jgi:hypothetical protein
MALGHQHTAMFPAIGGRDVLLDALASTSVQAGRTMT